MKEHPLHPRLPFDMKARAARATEDETLQRFIFAATHEKDRGRVRVCQRAFGERYDAIRELAGAIKQHTLDHLDAYLEQFIDRAEAAGARVHFAAGAEQANAIGARIAAAHGCKLCVKSKSMVTEEIGLLPVLERLGVEVVETDLGEFIIQLDHDAPSHIVTPMIHKDRRSVARAFVRELGAEYTEDPEQLTRIARAHMRTKYRRADLGISGANFLIAETGSVVLCTNEGNADFSVSGPPVHVVFVGIEKVVPTMRHLAVFLKLLARSATAQELTVYTTIITGPRRAAEHDGPGEVHIILVDNGRTEILRAPTRELLRCIRCGACLNACPVYRKVGGGHAYGAVYSGPIGSVITPLFKGIENYPDLPQASSLCGACLEACPVKIDLPRHLVRLRRESVERKVTRWRDRQMYRLWAAVLERPWAFGAARAFQRWLLRSWAGSRDAASRTPEDPLRNHGWVRALPGLGRGWTECRDLITPPSGSFRRWWRSRGRGAERKGGGP
ncbi:MAG: iron-sulfur cluster-binding protein [Planctomycetes bacterium]|nr:iron-sulfur cluster-binding protein [Planctomycetota bacterium]